MKIYLHIGQPRTGTTTLQFLLMSNKDRLAERGVDYPQIGLLHPVRGIAQHKLAFSLLPKWPKVAPNGYVAPDVVWSELLQHIARVQDDNRTVLVSSEAFLSVPENGIAYIQTRLSGHQVIPLCVRRDPEEWRHSWNSHQIIRGNAVGEPKGPAKDIAKPKLDLWNKFFQVRCFEYGPTVVTDILAELGVEADKLEPVKRRNKRLTPELLEMVKRLNQIPMRDENRHLFREEILLHLKSSTPELDRFLNDALMTETQRPSFNERLIDLLA